MKYSAIQNYRENRDFNYLCDGITISEIFNNGREVDTRTDILTTY